MALANALGDYCLVSRVKGIHGRSEDPSTGIGVPAYDSWRVAIIRADWFSKRIFGWRQVSQFLQKSLARSPSSQGTLSSLFTPRRAYILGTLEIVRLSRTCLRDHNIY